jgi:hypothetical protein
VFDSRQLVRHVELAILLRTAYVVKRVVAAVDLPRLADLTPRTCGA